MRNQWTAARNAPSFPLTQAFHDPFQTAVLAWFWLLSNDPFQSNLFPILCPSVSFLSSTPSLLEAPRSFCSWPYHSTKFSAPSSSARPCQNNPTRSRMHSKSCCILTVFLFYFYFEASRFWSNQSLFPYTQLLASLCSLPFSANWLICCSLPSLQYICLYPANANLTSIYFCVFASLSFFFKPPACQEFCQHEPGRERPPWPTCNIAAH